MLKLIKEILKKVSYRWLGALYSAAMGIAVSSLVARVLGPIEFGQFSVALAAGAIFAVFVNLGLSELIFREGSLSARKISSTKVLINFSAGYSATLSILAVVLIFCTKIQNQALWIVTVILIFFLNMFQMISSRAFALQRYFLDFSLQFTYRSLGFLFVCLFFLAGLNTASYTLLAISLGAAVTLLCFRKATRVVPRLTLTTDTFKTSIYFAGITLMSTLYTRMDIVILKAFNAPERFAGEYAAASRLLEFVAAICTPVALLVAKEIRGSRYYGSITPINGRRVVVYGAIIGLSISVGFCLISSFLVEILFGPQYTTTASYARAISLSFVFLIPNAVLSQLYLFHNLEKVYLFIASVTALINVSLNYLLISFGHLDLIKWSPMLTELVLFLLILYKAHTLMSLPIRDLSPSK